MAEQNTPHISFLIVTYNSEDVIAQCLHNIRRFARDMRYEILIACNDQREIITDEPFVQTFVMRDNGGFSVANNFLVRQSSGKFLFFLNPDTQHFRGDFATLLSTLQDARVGIVAPQLRTKDDREEEWSYNRYTTTPYTIFLRNLFPTLGNCHTRDTSCSVAWVSGAAFMMSRTVFDAVGGFDERFFLYYEDVDLCRRVRAQGYRIIRERACSIRHLGAQSMPSEDKQKRHYAKSQNHYLRKYHHPKLIAITNALRKIKYHRKTFL